MSRVKSLAEQGVEGAAAGDDMDPRALSTPVLLLDLDLMEANLRRMASFFQDASAKLRPHFKTHQVISLGSKQLQAGAIGITCARLEHAEALVDRGITNVFVASEVAGETMVRRFVELSRQAAVIAVVDSAKVISDMAREAQGRTHEVNVIVDLNLGLNRCGVPPGEAALRLTERVLESGITFRGLMGYHGNLRLPPGPEKEQKTRSALQKLIETKTLLEHNGIPVEIISCGGTSDYSIAATFPEVTEIQAGSYLLMDTWYEPLAPEFKPALSVLATVISKTSGTMLVANAGVKAVSTERGLPMVKGNQGLSIRAMHAEHALIDILDPAASPEVGDQIEIWVQHLDATISLHNEMYGMRNGKLVERLRIEH
jgi:D-serine deaminase-like pyridoxal phosphate-dependent protein